MVVIRPGDHVWLTYEGDKKLEVAIGVQIKKAEGGKILGRVFYFLICLYLFEFCPTWLFTKVRHFHSMHVAGEGGQKHLCFVHLIYLFLQGNIFTDYYNVKSKIV